MNTMNVGNINKVGLQEPSKNGEGSKAKANEFKEALSQAVQKKVEIDSDKAVKPLSFKFSNHAVERMQRRGISYTPDQLQSIERAVNEADKKGSKEALILSDNSAKIVSVKNKTVVTVMDKENLKDNVFTNIDSTVII